MTLINIFYIVFLLFITFYEPVYGYFGYKKFIDRYSTGSFRLRYYRFIQFSLWMPALILVAFIAISPLSFSETGMRLPVFSDHIFNRYISGAIIVVAIAYFITLVVQYFVQVRNKKYRKRIAEMQIPGNLEYVLPATPQEKKAWLGVSLTAGIAEEIIYRGVLLYVLAKLFPAVPLWIIVPVASLLFGLGHSYQGSSGVLKTTVAGLFFCILYFATDSLIPGMLLHFLQDYVAKDVITIRREEAAAEKSQDQENQL